ncbi:hypothetical protein [Streptomyces tirandamycinicus]|uniref:hypothetical protein n=1 Tax=Streptomyces tirandamycinicus TaxID=2174846 RepID=UPI0011B29A2B|nr:hypothetical protein [Streptomyces tirandamycinicus]
MSVETAAPAAAGGAIPAAAVVRTPAGVLHLLPPGDAAPRLPVFTVPLLCSPDPAGAPAVRRYGGEWNGPKACRACVRVWRGDPAPVEAEALELPGAEPVEPAERRVPSLPREHRGRPLVWCDWEPQLRLSHYSSECEHCGDPGPGKMATGRGREPLGRYVAFWCSACGHARAYECVESWDLQVIYVERGTSGRR